MSRSTIVVTGATGKVGRHLITDLVRDGHVVRAVNRRPASALLPADAEAYYGDLDDRSSLNGARRGLSPVALDLRRRGGRPGQDARPSRRARRDLSSMGSSGTDGRRTEPVAFHARVEAAIRGVDDLDWAFLRPSGFAANTYMWLGQILRSDVVQFPYARCGRSLIHEADIVAVAARVLASPEPWHDVHLLTGPEVLTHDDQVRIIGETIGRRLRFEESPPELAREQLIAAWGDELFVDTAMEAWRQFEAEPEMVTDAVQTLTGGRPRTFKQWTHDHITDFGGNRDKSPSVASPDAANR